MADKLLNLERSGYNIVVKRNTKGVMFAFYSPCACPQEVVRKWVPNLDMAEHIFRELIYRKRKAFYCSGTPVDGKDWSIRLHPGVEAEYSVLVYYGSTVVDLGAVCVLKGQMEDFIRDNLEVFLAEVGVQPYKGKGHVLYFNFPTVRPLRIMQTRRKKNVK